MAILEDYLILYVRDKANTANPQLLEAKPPTQLNTKNTTKFNPAEFGDISPGRLGYRVYWGGEGTNLSIQDTVDISSYQFIKIGGVLSGDCTQEWDTKANGGVQFIIFDINNNFIGWNILGKDLVNFREDIARGYLDPNDGGSALNSPRWVINLTESPSIESTNPIDLTRTNGFEVHFNTISTYRSNRSFAMGGVYVFNPEICTGTFTTKDIFDQVIGAKNSYLALFQHLYGDHMFFAGNAGKINTLMYGFQIGDGVTPTNLKIENETFVFTAPINSPTAINLEYPFVIGLNGNNRPLRMNQSSSDGVEFNQIDFQAVDDVAGGTATIEVTGQNTGIFKYSGTAKGINFILNHGIINGVTFNSCYGLKINNLVSITNSSYRNAPEGNGLELTSGAGDYSNLDITFDENNGFDLTLGIGGVGLYDLTSLKVATGYTLKIYNNSLNDIEIALSAIANTIVTDGGNVTIVQPRNSGRIDGLIVNSRVRIFNRTTGVELVNQIESTSVLIYDYDEGIDITTGDILDISISNTQGIIAYQIFEGVATAQTNGFSATVLQRIDPIYEENAIDGSLVVDFNANFPNIEITNGTTITTLPRLYAWYVNYLYTADGVRNWRGILTASDVSNYKINTNVADTKLDNVNNNQAFFEGDRVLIRSDGAKPILLTTTGGYGISIAPSRVNTVSVAGGSGSIDQSTYNNLMLNVPSSTKNLYKATSFSLDQTSFNGLMSGVSDTIKATYKTNTSGIIDQIDALNDLSLAQIENSTVLPKITDLSNLTVSIDSNNFNTLIDGVPEMIKENYRANVDNLNVNITLTPQQIREEIDSNSLIRKLLTNTNRLELNNDRYVVMDDDNITPILIQETYNNDGVRDSEQITEFRKSD